MGKTTIGSLFEQATGTKKDTRQVYDYVTQQYTEASELFDLELDDESINTIKTAIMSYQENVTDAILSESVSTIKSLTTISPSEKKILMEHFLGLESAGSDSSFAGLNKGPSIPSKTEISAEVYNRKIKELHKALKECADNIEMLFECEIVDDVEI